MPFPFSTLMRLILAGSAPPPAPWFEPDANFAFSSITDTNTASADPSRGSTLALTGTAATASAGLWTLATNTKYASPSGAQSTIPASGTPFFLATVLDKNTQGSGYEAIVKFGAGGAFIQFATRNTDFVTTTYFGSSVYTTLSTISAMGVGAHAYWIYSDGASTPTYYFGKDQADVATYVATGATGQTLLTDRQIGSGGNVTMKVGSVESVSRAGMTLADAKAIVAKMQTHHGIA